MECLLLGRDRMFVHLRASNEKLTLVSLFQLRLGKTRIIPQGDR
jgi:hypothetical protein